MTLVKVKFLTTGLLFFSTYLLRMDPHPAKCHPVPDGSDDDSNGIVIMLLQHSLVHKQMVPRGEHLDPHHLLSLDDAILTTEQNCCNAVQKALSIVAKKYTI